MKKYVWLVLVTLLLFQGSAFAETEQRWFSIISESTKIKLLDIQKRGKFHSSSLYTWEQILCEILQDFPIDEKQVWLIKDVIKILEENIGHYLAREIMLDFAEITDPSRRIKKRLSIMPEYWEPFLLRTPAGGLNIAGYYNCSLIGCEWIALLEKISRAMILFGHREISEQFADLITKAVDKAYINLLIEE